MWTLRSMTSRTSRSRPPATACSRRGLLLVLGALLLVRTIVAPSALSQDSPIRVLETGADYAFSQSLTFSARVESDYRLAEAILFFGRVGSPLVRRVYPELAPEKRVEVRYVEEIQPGQYPPGADFRVWWQFTDAEGNTLRTDTERFQYNDDRFDWRVLSGKTIDYYYYDERESRARELLEAGEGAIQRLALEMGIPVASRVRVYSYARARDMSDALVLRSESYDDRVVTLGVVVDDYTLLLLSTHRDADLTIAHELTHVLVGIATDNPYIGVPRWLDEGLAMYAEGELPYSNQRALDRAISEDSLLSLRSMTSYSGQAGDVDLYYGQAYSVVAFMLDRFGREGMTDLLTVFSEGTRQDDALLRTYGFGLNGLEDLWRASLGVAERD